MKITRASEYAVRCVYFLASKKIGVTVKKNEVSCEMEIPEQFLAKIAQQLARAGIIGVVQGSKGGVKLLKDPREITLLEVIEAIMGKIFLNECVQDMGSSMGYCKRKPDCSIHLVWRKVQQKLRETLRKENFKELVKGKICF